MNWTREMNKNGHWNGNLIATTGAKIVMAGPQGRYYPYDRYNRPVRNARGRIQGYKNEETAKALALSQ